MDLVPFGRGRDLPTALAPAQLVPLARGEFAAVHITVESAALDMFLANIDLWFENRDEVIFISSGVSNKTETGYVVLEWEECQPDQLFIRILDTNNFVIGYTLYIRSEEAYS